ncbi:MAG: bifunctional hydroxymethylpyrimidine kinase/phosphomethylpyrimidine kinase, partial [Nitrospiria bacterium]
KTGMLYSAEIVQRVAKRLRERNLPHLVVDPVMVSTSGATLLQDSAIEGLTRELFPLAQVVTPNVPEAERLTGMTIRTLDDAKAAAAAVFTFGPRAVLLKGGHLSGAPATDVLYDGVSWTLFAGERIETRGVHGTGCTYSAAIAAHLARGESLDAAVRRSKAYVTEAIRHGLAIGRGTGPTHHFFNLRGDV